jgi:hypothetical protein
MQGHHYRLAALDTASRPGEQGTDTARRGIEEPDDLTRELADPLHGFEEQRSGRRR